MIVQFPVADQRDRVVGERLRRLREARGLAPEVLCPQMRLRLEELAAAERGRFHLDSSRIYAATLALHVPMRMMFEDGDVSGLRRL